MEHRAEARIDLIDLASNISTLKSTSNIELLAVASSVTLKKFRNYQINHEFISKLIRA
jgi:hypothetical protein